MKPVVIVGGGIAGLSAAWELFQKGIPFVLLEESGRLGGKITTARFRGFLIEGAADAFITQKPHAEQLARELGMEDDLITTLPENKKTYLLREGKLNRIPPSFKLIAPLDDEEFLASNLLSEEGKKRLLEEQFIPPRQGGGDESLASFITRRFGPEATTTIAEPMLGGIYVSNPEKLSMQAAFPQYLKMEQEYGSVIRGVRENNRKNPQTKPIFYSLKNGMGSLIERLYTELHEHIRLGGNVVKVDREHRVYLEEGEVIEASQVILATPAATSKAFLQENFPETAELMNELETNSSAVAVFGFNRDQIEFDVSTYGFIVSGTEPTPLLAGTIHSSKFEGRAPEKQVLIRAYLGGHRNPHIPEMHSPEIAEMGLNALRPILGIQGNPLFWRVYNWLENNPMYKVGHIERVKNIQNSLPDTIRLIGSSYGGVGIPDCIRYAREMVRHMVP
ncbi:protoporphyrinogen oxidase [Deinococcus cellulosilyticus]|uniref:Coproporphyrinogen III oxidase n=1 Tax=Deinococcus cellulosilyticus (strain DSM 18568 / NBRC 106333 / KACC 11606 / 5516J-15) TaxID=1223518 RepID=A0A511N9V7_DEIC1|nr:protoporphyrinogen oxidase [Deinococcus cellulosilyticus]GEM49580.1 protoporphyrinogen oxidase [Deinococcus cellulosilyticus NBRC 106333 = KACC 11606]